MNPLLNLLSSTLLSHWKVHQLSTQIINIHRLHDTDQVMFFAHLVICRIDLMRWRLLCSTKKWKLIFALHKMYSHKFLLFRMSLILGFICQSVRTFFFFPFSGFALTLWVLNQVRQPCFSQLLRHRAACTYRTNTACVCVFFFIISPHFLSQLRCKWFSWICMKSQSFRYLLLPPPSLLRSLSFSHSSSLNSNTGSLEKCLMGDNHKEFSQ